jgi:polygalacturonase
MRTALSTLLTGLAAGVLLLAGPMSVRVLNFTAGTITVLPPPAGSGYRVIQQALDRLPAAGGTVVLAPGVYEIDRPLRLDRNGLALRGDGEATVLRLADQADCPVVILGPVKWQATAVVHDLSLADLVIDGNRSHQLMEGWVNPANNSGIQNNGVMIQSASNVTVSEVVAAHCRSGGLVTANGVRHLTVSDFTAYDNQYDGLACYETEDSVFTRLDLHDNRAAGISLDLDFDHNVISDATLAGNDLGIFMRQSSNNQFSNVVISQSRHDGVFMAQWVRLTASGWVPTPQTECADNHFDGLDVHECAGVAFRVNDAGCVRNVIEDAQFTDNARGSLVEPDANLVRVQDGVE